MKTTNSTLADNVPQIIQDKLRAYQTRFKMLALAEGVAETLAVFLALFAFNLLLDWFIPMSNSTRALFVVATWISSLGVLISFVWFKARKTFSDATVALALERSAPSLDEKLVSTVELIETPDPDEFKGSPALINALTRQTTTEVALMDFQKALSPKRAVRFASIALGLICALALGAVIAGENFSLLMNRFVWFWDDSLPRATPIALVATTGDVTCESGSDVTIEAAITRGNASHVALHCITADGKRAVVEMERKSDNTFSATLRGVSSDARYYVESRRVQSDTHNITALRGPQIESLKITYAYPAFTRLQPRQETTRDGDIVAPVGTNITIEATFDRNITGASLQLVDSKSQPLTPSTPRTAVAQFTVAKDTTFQIRATDERKFSTPDGVIFRVKAQANASPTVALVEPVTDLQLSRPAPVRVAYNAHDDYAIKSLRLVWEIAGQPERHGIDLPLPANNPETALGVHEWNLAGNSIASGSRVTFWLEAEDEAADGRPNKSLSSKLHLNISADAEFSIVTPEFLGAQKIGETLENAAQQVAQNAAAATTLFDEFNHDKLWNAKLTTLRESLRAAEPPATRALDEWRAAMDAQVKVLAASRSEKTSRADLELVAAVMRLAVNAHADTAKAAASLPSPFSNEDTARLTQTAAQRSARALETTACVRDQFARIADSNEMQVMAKAAQRLIATHEQAQRFAQARAEGRSTDVEMRRAHEEAKFITDVLAENFAALAFPLADNAGLLKMATELMKTKVLPSIELTASLLEKSNHSEAAAELAMSVQDTKEIELMIAVAAKQSARAAEQARTILRERLLTPVTPELSGPPKVLDDIISTVGSLSKQSPPEQIEKAEAHIEDRKADLDNKFDQIDQQLEEAVRNALNGPKPDTQFAKDANELQKVLKDLKKRNDVSTPNLADADERKKFLDDKRDLKQQVEELARDFGKIEAARETQQLADKFNGLASDQSKLRGDSQQTNPDDAKKIDDLKDKQHGLTNRIEDAERKLNEAVNQHGKTDSDLSKALNAVRNQVEALKPSEQSNDAARALNDGKPREAATPQRNTQEALEGAASQLQRAGEQAARVADEARKNLAAKTESKPLDEQLKGLAEKQEGAAKKTGDAAKRAPENKADDNAREAEHLHAEQDKMLRATDDLARQLSLQSMDNARNGTGNFQSQRDLLDAAKAAERATADMKAAQDQLSAAAANPNPAAQKDAFQKAKQAQADAANNLAQTAKDLATAKGGENVTPEQQQVARENLRKNEEALTPKEREQLDRGERLDDMVQQQKDLMDAVKRLNDGDNGNEPSPQPKDLAKLQGDLAKRLDEQMKRDEPKGNKPPQEPKDAGDQQGDPTPAPPKGDQDGKEGEPTPSKPGDKPSDQGGNEPKPGDNGKPQEAKGSDKPSGKPGDSSPNGNTPSGKPDPSQPGSSPAENAATKMKDAAGKMQQGDTGEKTLQTMKGAEEQLKNARNQAFEQVAKPSAMPSPAPSPSPSEQLSSMGGGNTANSTDEVGDRHMELGKGDVWKTILPEGETMEQRAMSEERVSPEWERLVKMYFELLSAIGSKPKK